MLWNVTKMEKESFFCNNGATETKIKSQNKLCLVLSKHFPKFAVII
jgi:hypothetical protein